MPTFKVMVFWDVLLWKPQILQLLLFSFNKITWQTSFIYILIMQEYLGIHFTNTFLCFNTFKTTVMV